MKPVFTCLILAHLCVGILNFSQCFAQSGLISCPRFIILRDKGEKLENNFTNMYPKYSQYADTVGSALFIEKNQFRSMLIAMAGGDYRINGFRVFLAKKDNKLRLVFTGLRGNKDSEIYFVINKNGTYGQIIKNNNSDRLLSDQVKSYQKSALVYTDTALKSDMHNTATYIFNRGIIYDMITEMYRQSDNESIVGIKFKLGAYTDNLMNPNPSATKDFTNRLMLGFSFIKNDGSEIFLNELPESDLHACRLDERVQKLADFLKSNYLLKTSEQLESNQIKRQRDIEKEIQKLATAIGADTGVPCPPGTGCGTPSLPKQ